MDGKVETRGEYLTMIYKCKIYTCIFSCIIKSNRTRLEFLLNAFSTLSSASRPLFFEKVLPPLLTLRDGNLEEKDPTSISCNFFLCKRINIE